ncbi:MAG: phosphoribosyl-ATP diphosphatase [Kiloniellales bacterium]
MARDDLDGSLLDALYEVIESRRDGDVEKSRTAKLFARGVPKIAQKVGEEAVEALIEAVAGNRKALAAESADLLYHLLVMWAACGMKPEEVWAILDKRRGAAWVSDEDDN